MPNTKSAQKYQRTSQTKQKRNLGFKNKMKSLIRNTRSYIASNKSKEAGVAFKKAIKAIDKASQKGIIKKGNAARKKQRLNKALKKISSSRKSNK